MIVLKIWYINFIKMINILCLIIFFSKINSFCVISVSKAWRSGRVGSGRVGSGRVGSGRAGSLQISTIGVKTNTFCSMEHISKMLSFRDTKFFENLIWEKVAPRSSLRSLRFAHNDTKILTLLIFASKSPHQCLVDTATQVDRALLVRLTGAC